MAALPDEGCEAQDRARLRLLEWGVDEEALVASVARFAEGEDSRRVLERAEALLRSGPNGRQASLPALHRVLGWSPAEAERARAAELLGSLGPVAADDPETVALLRRHAVAADEDPAVAAAAATALKTLGVR